MKKLFLALALSTLPALAHDPGLSATTVDFSSREILVQVAFAPADLAALRPLSLTDIAPRSIVLQTALGPLRATSVEAREVGTDHAEFTLRFPRPLSGPVTVRSPLLAQMAFGHRQALTVRDLAGATVLTELLSATSDSAPLPSLSTAAPRRRNGLALLASAVLGALTLGWLASRRRPVTAAA